MKKLICAILSLALCASFLNQVSVNAATNEIYRDQSNSVLSLRKDNFNYIEGAPGDKHLVYTYDSNGSTYKVIENASDSFDEVNSTIYKKNKNGVFVEFATQNLTVNESTFTQKTNINGKVTVETLDVSFNVSESINTLSGLDVSPFMAAKVQDMYCEPILGDCYTVRGWQWEGPNTNGSNSIVNWTVTAIVAVIVFIASDGNGKLAGAAAAGAIANKIVDDLIPVVYYTQWYYTRRLENPPRGLQNFIVASNWYTVFYSDSDRKNEIGSIDEYKYANGYTPA